MDKDIPSLEKQPISTEEAKSQLVRWLGVGSITRVREIFETYDVPEEILMDEDIQWKLGSWKANLLHNSSVNLVDEPREEILQFLDSTFPMSEKTRHLLDLLAGDVDD
ncbi:hypothetical protein A3D88_01405 [Candidatus Peribacteria bacterium RIFCSPHIGHO2_02_FULL_52_16]|nr:MAG: hypothetical protein A2706_03645 [Candidatus Peribacteria bacterium RIFCSPHIGHO2_01_FULL_51_35]OGJ60976.1 MAG: hypothetical protein A3D88_01405 [Candidatus Peribacteria bacterium RIFCSPHIGHO2_02_FULL_52_16]